MYVKLYQLANLMLFWCLFVHYLYKVMDLNFPLCECSVGSIVMKTSHTAKNIGSKFFCCPNGTKVVTNLFCMFTYYITTSDYGNHLNYMLFCMGIVAMVSFDGSMMSQ